MPSLREWQRAFSAAAVFNDAAALASLRIVVGGMKPEARIDIYRANVLGNYRKALAATYPVIKRLVGAPFFDAASGPSLAPGFPSEASGVSSSSSSGCAASPPGSQLPASGVFGL